jgi:pullulanase
MVSKFIVDSVNYWADEYHIDGFRFDLVGLIDTDTINKIVETVHEKHPDVIFYGEGWTMSTAVTKTGYSMTTQTNSSKVPGFAFFSDTVRNLIKGGTFGGISAGYISGGNANVAELNACFKGMPTWCPTPSQSINYISCHDNNTLFDHISMVATSASLADKIAMNKLGAAFYMSAQGIPFFQAGEEMLRTKPDGEGGYNENSYNAPDEVNSLKWDDLNKAEYMDVYEYYKGLIAFRKAHPALRLTDSASVDSAVEALVGLPAGVVAYNIKGGVNGETAEGIFAAFNASKSAQTVKLPAGTWNICVNGEDAGVASLGTAEGTVQIPAVSSVILVKGDVPAPTTEPSPTEPAPAPGGMDMNMIIIIAAVAVVAVAVVVALVLKKKK